MKRFSSRGFTLVELLVALAVTGMIGAGAAGVIYQVFNVSALNSNRLDAIHQVENVVQWMTRDAQEAQTISVNSSALSGFPVRFGRVQWDSVSQNITYTINGTSMFRQQVTNGGNATRTLIAIGINSLGTNTTCTYSPGSLNLKITSHSTGYRATSETRQVVINQRATK